MNYYWWDIKGDISLLKCVKLRTSTQSFFRGQEEWSWISYGEESIGWERQIRSMHCKQENNGMLRILKGMQNAILIPSWQNFNIKWKLVLCLLCYNIQEIKQKTNCVGIIPILHGLTISVISKFYAFSKVISYGSGCKSFLDWMVSCTAKVTKIERWTNNKPLLGIIPEQGIILNEIYNLEGLGHIWCKQTTAFNEYCAIQGGIQNNQRNHHKTKVTKMNVHGLSSRIISPFQRCIITLSQTVSKWIFITYSFLFFFFSLPFFIRLSMNIWQFTCIFRLSHSHLTSNSKLFPFPLLILHQNFFLRR